MNIETIIKAINADRDFVKKMIVKKIIFEKNLSENNIDNHKKMIEYLNSIDICKSQQAEYYSLYREIVKTGKINEIPNITIIN